MNEPHTRKHRLLSRRCWLPPPSLVSTIAAAITVTIKATTIDTAFNTHRISLAALYLGTEDHEQRLIAALDKTLQARPNVTAQLLFDGRRARRVSRVTKMSTVSLLEPILTKYPGRITLGLLTMPAAKKVSFLPSPLDEIAGVMHMKAFAVDDELIISGANLSTGTRVAATAAVAAVVEVVAVWRYCCRVVDGWSLVLASR